jgi:hypothetical protein
MMEARTGYSLKCVLRRNHLSELCLSARRQEWHNSQSKTKVSVPGLSPPVHSSLHLSRASARDSIFDCPDDFERLRHP